MRRHRNLAEQRSAKDHIECHVGSKNSPDDPADWQALIGLTPDRYGRVPVKVGAMQFASRSPG